MKITRSFSKKIQLRQYEPIEFFCAVEHEVPDVNDMQETSRFLDEFCQEEVEKSLNKFRAIDTKKAKDIGRDTAELETQELFVEEN
jgi:hypothetical protein